MNKVYRWIGGLTAVILAAGLLVILGGINQPVDATEHKMTICHRTDSVSNPYQKIDIDLRGVAGHFEEHKGDVAYTTAVAQQMKDDGQKWGDIIPPFGVLSKSLNWDAYGQAVYHNGCKPVQVVTVTAPQATEPNCEVQSMTVTPPSIKGIVWQPSTATTLQPSESVTYTATAETGYVIDQSSQTTWKFTNDFDVKQCIEVGPAIINYQVTCNNDRSIDVAFTNSGESDGTAELNGKTINVAAGTTVHETLSDNSKVTIVIDNQTVLDKIVTCDTEQGGGDTTTTTTPVATGQVTVATTTAKTLPYTAGNQSAVIAAMAVAGALFISALGLGVRYLSFKHSER